MPGRDFSPTQDAAPRLYPLLKVLLVKAQKKKLGKTIRVSHLSLGYSQENFASVCDLHRTYIGELERGEKNVTLNNIVKIAEALEMTAATLMEKAHL